MSIVTLHILTKERHLETQLTPNASNCMFIQSGSETNWHCKLSEFVSKESRFVLTAAPGWPTGPIGPGGPGGPYQHTQTSTQTMSKTTKQQRYEETESSIVIIETASFRQFQFWSFSIGSPSWGLMQVTHMLSFSSLSALLTMLSNLTLHGQRNITLQQRHARNKALKWTIITW